MAPSKPIVLITGATDGLGRGIARALAKRGVTVNALHPATYMPTKIVTGPISTLEQGVSATMRLIVDPALAGVTGKYFDETTETRAQEQAYDPEARGKLRQLSEGLTGEGCALVS